MPVTSLVQLKLPVVNRPRVPLLVNRRAPIVPPEMPFPPHWQLYVRVPDVHAAASRVKAGGGQVLNGPMEVPGGDWIVNAMDPQGATFSLHQAKQS